LCFWWRRGRVELPVQRKLPRISYRLSQLFNLARLAPADRVQPGQSISLSPPCSTLGQWHPGFSSPTPDPPGWGQGGCAAYLIRRRLVLVLCQLCFATCLMRVAATSACNPVTYFPCRNHASPWIPVRVTLPVTSSDRPSFSRRAPAPALSPGALSLHACRRASCPGPAPPRAWRCYL